MSIKSEAIDEVEKILDTCERCGKVRTGTGGGIDNSGPGPDRKLCGECFEAVYSSIMDDSY